MQTPIKVTYKSTNRPMIANQYLRELSKYPIIGCDFEVAKKYTEEQLKTYQAEFETLDRKTNLIRWQRLNALLNATALDHPSFTQLTHLSIAISHTEAYVFILDNEIITKRVLAFLTTTKQTQIWHNASYDFRQIQYRTGKFPLIYEDTQILAKTILNHTDNQQSLTGLKHLVGYAYGAWGISADNFTLSQMYDPQMLLYSATDPCATLYLWDEIQSHIKATDGSTS